MNLEFNNNELKTILAALCFAGAYCDIAERDDKDFKELYSKIVMLFDKPSQLKIVNDVIDNVINKEV